MPRQPMLAVEIRPPGGYESLAPPSYDCDMHGPLKFSAEHLSANQRVPPLTVAALLLLIGSQDLPAETPLASQVEITVNPAPPSIPARQFHLSDFGAVPDGKTLNTHAFQKAIGAVDAAGGGHLIVGPGTYRTQPFSLCSHLDLHLDAGAIIVGPASFTDYGVPEPSAATKESLQQAGKSLKALISGSKLTDVQISGTGTIDGNGSLWWPWSERPARTDPTRLVYPRPRIIAVSSIQRFHISDVTLLNSPQFHLSVGQGTDILIQHVHIKAPGDAPNAAAIGISSGSIIRIDDCDLDAGDDNIAFNAFPNSGTLHDCLVENCRCLHGHGISIGSMTADGISQLLVRHCRFDGTESGIRIKSAAGRGGIMEAIRYSDIFMNNVRTPINIDFTYFDSTNAPDIIDPQNPRLPHIHDVFIDHLTAANCPTLGKIVGTPKSPVTAVTIQDSTLAADKGMVIRDADSILFDRVGLRVKQGKVLDETNAKVIWNKPPGQ